MSSRVFTTALRRASALTRPTMMSVARPALRQSVLKATTVNNFTCVKKKKKKILTVYICIRLFLLVV